jgi:hypothetical protein
MKMNLGAGGNCPIPRGWVTRWGSISLTAESAELAEKIRGILSVLSRRTSGRCAGSVVKWLGKPTNIETPWKFKRHYILLFVVRLISIPAALYITQILRHRISQGRTFFKKPHIR